MTVRNKSKKWDGLQSFRTLFPYFKRFRWLIFLGIFSLATVDCLQLIIPYIIKWVVDDLTAGKATSLGLLKYALWIALLAIGIGGFRYVWRLSLLTPARRIEEDLRNRLFRHILSLPESFFLEFPTGDLMARFVNDLNMVRMAVAFGMVGFMDAFVLGISTLVFMIWISRDLTLYVLIPMPFLVLATALISRRIHTRAQRVQKQFATLTETVREGVSGVRVIRAYRAETRQGRKVEEEGEKLLRENLALAKVRGIFFPILMFLVNFSMVIVLYFGGRETILARITPGDFVAFTNYLMLLAWPMMAMGWVISLLQRGAASLMRINEVLAQTSPLHAVRASRQQFDPDAPIICTHLWFSYPPGDRPVLKDCSLSFERGRQSIVAGEIGCGKSTLLMLLLRQFDPQKGAIALGEQDIRKIGLTDYRQLFAFVSQEPVVFSQTILENLTFGDGTIPSREIYKALSVVKMREEIEAFPDGLETLIGEKGVTLSGGQRQRLALARALLSKRPFLILDAPFSSVDVETQKAIMAAMTALFPGKTLIMTSQRVSSFMAADRIFMMHDGEIVASGTHAELLKTSDAYVDFVRERKLCNGLACEEGPNAL